MRKFAFIALVFTAIASSSHAQTAVVLIDTVTVTAVDPSASEDGPDPGMFEIRRTGPTNFPLSVFYHLEGSASNSVDYEAISSLTTIPAGSWAARIPVNPLADKLIEGPETVVLQIIPSPLLCPAPSCGYFIGWPSNATVTIADSTGIPPTNHPPFVQLNSPESGQQFIAPADIPLNAYVQDVEDGFDLTVEFFEGEKSLGFGTFVPTRCAPPFCPSYALTWSNATPGSYVITARATDRDGATSISDGAYITVLGGVNIYATDPDATEQSPLVAAPPDTATFTVRRSGDTSESITVFYAISGTASNGVDYEKLSGQVAIPAGASAADIVVTPIDDNLVEGTETIELTLIAPCLPCLFTYPACYPAWEVVAVGTNCYPIGAHNMAVAYIHDNDGPPPTNHPPFVQLNSPRTGQQFIAPAEIPLNAYVQDVEDGFDLTVEFFEGDKSLGFGTFIPTRCATPFCPYYALTWSNAMPGDYVITARATDRDGATSISDGAYITVLGGVNIYAADPDATEQSPLVAAAPDTATFTVRRSGDTSESITVFYAIGGTASNGIDYEKLSGQVAIPAGASTADILVTAIDDDLVEGTETVELTLLAPCPPCLWGYPACEIAEGTNCYPIGPHNMAVAYIHDNDGPPDTNFPVVTIVATDPIAVEGDFCGSNWWWTTSAGVGAWTTNSLPPFPCPRTNTATFEVRRNVGTNSDLTVYYRIGGTASNGIDYLTLPNEVIIPAGRYAARIEVIPIDDNIPERIETVVLSLTAPTSPLPYRLGYPRQAAAVILDNDQPRPPCGRLSDGLFHLCAPGTNGFGYSVRSSSDLVTWTSECTNIVTDGAIHFIDPDAAAMGNRFYQVVPEPSYSPLP